jgi:hypothetical protein
MKNKNLEIIVYVLVGLVFLSVVFVFALKGIAYIIEQIK